MNKALVFKRNNTNLKNKESQVDGTLKNSQNSQIREGFGWFFKKKAHEDGSKKEDFDSDLLNLGPVEKKPAESISDNKVAMIIKKIRNSDEKFVVPKLDLMSGHITYPMLEEIGESDSDVGFLETLASASMDVLEKSVYERLVVCPQHPDSFNVNVRLYCPKCNSMDIEKLHLFEHKICGYISEKKNFDVSNAGIITQCPSCKKSIKDSKKELRIPAMWYTCLYCKEKFDDVAIKLHCRKFNHDFETNMARTTSIPCFGLKDIDTESNFDSSLIQNIKNLLLKYEFNSEENCSIKGKSGHYNNIDLVGKDKNNNTIFVFITKSNKEIAESEINSKIIHVLDSCPSLAIIIGSHMSIKAKLLASRYDISVIDYEDAGMIISSFEEILSEKLGILEKL